jgi:hypothetical protein
MQMTPGRLHALCATLATLIRVAYGYSPMQLDFNDDGRRLGMQLDTVYRHRRRGWTARAGRT